MSTDEQMIAFLLFVLQTQDEPLHTEWATRFPELYQLVSLARNELERKRLH